MTRESFSNKIAKGIYNSLKAYNLINSVVNIKTPRFVKYNDFKKLLRGEPNELF